MNELGEGDSDSAHQQLRMTRTPAKDDHAHCLEVQGGKEGRHLWSVPVGATDWPCRGMRLAIKYRQKPDGMSEK